MTWVPPKSGRGEDRTGAGRGGAVITETKEGDEGSHPSGFFPCARFTRGLSSLLGLFAG